VDLDVRPAPGAGREYRRVGHTIIAVMVAFWIKPLAPQRLRLVHSATALVSVWQRNPGFYSPAARSRRRAILLVLARYVEKGVSKWFALTIVGCLYLRIKFSLPSPRITDIVLSLRVTSSLQ
jgi:hypothetical protein